jgi:hypothetical protein
MVLLPFGLLIWGTVPPGPFSHVMWLPVPVALMMATVCRFTVLAAPLTSTSPQDPPNVIVASSPTILISDWLPQSYVTAEKLLSTLAGATSRGTGQRPAGAATAVEALAAHIRPVDVAMATSTRIMITGITLASPSEARTPRRGALPGAAASLSVFSARVS